MDQPTVMARWACAMSLAIHAGALGTLCLPSGDVQMAVTDMEVGSVQFDATTEPNVTLSAEVPRNLPDVVALPLQEPIAANSIDAIVPVAAIEAAPRTPTVPQPAQITPRIQLPPGTATTFFGVPATGTSVVYVIDRSASMGLEDRLRRACLEVSASLAQMSETTRTQVIAYSRTAEPMCSGLINADTATIAATSERLIHLTAEGGTDHVRALKNALILNPDVIYFLTDEDDLTAADVKAVTDYNRGRTIIHAICLVNPGPRDTPLGELARRNRGQFRVAK